MSYKLSRKAEDDIINLYIEGIRDFGVQQAEKYHAELETLFELLSHTPKLARERLEITPPVRIHRHKAHIIIYSLDRDENVFVIRIRHGREDWISDPVE